MPEVSRCQEGGSVVGVGGCGCVCVRCGGRSQLWSGRLLFSERGGEEGMRRDEALPDREWVTKKLLKTTDGSLSR